MPPMFAPPVGMLSQPPGGPSLSSFGPRGLTLFRTSSGYLTGPLKRSSGGVWKSSLGGVILPRFGASAQPAATRQPAQIHANTPSPRMTPPFRLVGRIPESATRSRQRRRVRHSAKPHAARASLPAARFCQPVSDGLPAHDAPPRIDVVGPLVLVLQVVGMFPDVDA